MQGGKLFGNKFFRQDTQTEAVFEGHEGLVVLGQQRFNALDRKVLGTLLGHEFNTHLSIACGDFGVGSGNAEAFGFLVNQQVVNHAVEDISPGELEGKG